jgi:hypothetical protein
MRASVLHRLDGATGKTVERDTGYAFGGLAEAERLIVKSERLDLTANRAPEN